MLRNEEVPGVVLKRERSDFEMMNLKMTGTPAKNCYLASQLHLNYFSSRNKDQMHFYKFDFAFPCVNLPIHLCTLHRHFVRKP